MKKTILAVMLGAVVLTGCSNKKVENEVKVDESGKVTVQEEVRAEKKEKKAKFFVHKGMDKKIYVEVPVYDPNYKDINVEVHAQGGGMVLSFMDYSILYGESAEYQTGSMKIDFSKIKKTEDIMPTIEPYILEFLSDHIITKDGEIPFKLIETNEKESKIETINGYEFNVVKGVMKVKMTDLQIIDLHFYGYFTMFEDYPLFFMSTSQDEAVRDESIEVLDNMMKTFRERRDTDN